MGLSRVRPGATAHGRASPRRQTALAAVQAARRPCARSGTGDPCYRTEMARVKCKLHGPPTGKTQSYSSTPYAPVGHPRSGMICGATSCLRPGLVWLTTVEEHEYRSGTRVFTVNDGSDKGAPKLRVADPPESDPDFSASTAVVDSPPWFVERMMNDSWQFGLLLTTGAVAVIECINGIYEYAGIVWIDVEMAERNDLLSDAAERLLFAPTSRTTASIRADAIVAAVELADT